MRHLLSAGILGLFILLAAGSGDSRSTSGSGSSGSSSRVRDAAYASPSDVSQAENFLASLPAACSASYAYASSDGTVNIRTICSGNDQSMDGLVAIKNGVVTHIQ